MGARECLDEGCSFWPWCGNAPGGCADREVGLAPTKFPGQHGDTAWELVVIDPQRAQPAEPGGEVCTSLGWEEPTGTHGGWDYCGWTLPRADQVLQPIMLRPGGGGSPLHGLAGPSVENIRVVFADGSTAKASTVSLEPARVNAVRYVAFFEAGQIPSAIVATGPSNDILEVPAPDRYADDPLPSIPVRPTDP